jgi:hypothetical protein
MKIKMLSALILLSSTTAASALTATVVVKGGPVVTAIGDEVGTPFDTFKFNDGSFLARATGLFAVTTFDFITGPNCDICGPTNGFASFALSSGSVHDTISLPFKWAGGDKDVIAFPKSTRTLVFGGQTFKLTTNSFTAASSGDPVHGTLTGSISLVPEPSTYALMLVGLGAIGLVRRRKSKT